MKLVSLFIALFLFISPVNAENSKANDIIMIMDASGSMWGQINKKAKITIAKSKIKDLLRELPKDLNLGLIAYGHRKKTDCNDIQLFSVKGGASRAGLIKSVDSISPLGKTPIAQSLEYGVKHAGKDSTIILVSDGKETCGRDPCAYVEKAKKQGVKFTAHVIGFDVKGETEKQLNCIADAGDGKYFSADNDKELKRALSAVKKEIAKSLPADLEKIKSLKTQVAELKRDNNLLQQSIAGCEEDVTTFKDELASCKNNNREIKKTIAQLKQEIEEAANDNKQLQQDLLVAKNEGEQLNNLATQLKQDVADGKNLYDQLDQNRHDLEKQNSDLKNQVKDSFEKNKDLEGMLMASLKERKELDSKKKDAEVKLDKSVIDNDALKNNNSYLTQQIQANADEINDLKQEIAYLKTQLDASGNKNQQLFDQNKNLRLELSELEGKTLELKSNNTKLYHKINGIMGGLESIVESNK